MSEGARGSYAVSAVAKGKLNEERPPGNTQPTIRRSFQMASGDQGLLL